MRGVIIEREAGIDRLLICVNSTLGSVSIRPWPETARVCTDHANRSAIAMSLVLRTFFNLLLVVSLAGMPLGTALSSVDAGHGAAMHDSTGDEPCHELVHEQAQVLPSNHKHHDSSMTEPCTCCGSDCGCPDSAGCHSVATLLVSALPAILLAVPVQARELFAVMWQDNYLSKDFPPDSPPPVA